VGELPTVEIRPCPARAFYHAEVSILLHEACANFLEEVALARASNEASGTSIDTTMLDDAELVWRLSDAYTHQEIAGA
jgi:hypothetical protein